MKQLHIGISGQEDIVIDLNDNEAIVVSFQNRAPRFLKPGEPQAELSIRGMRWANEQFFNFEWESAEIVLNKAICIRIVEDDRAPTPVRAEEMYVEPEKECSFCGQKVSDVKHLVEGSIFARICDQCVVDCQALMDSAHET